MIAILAFIFQSGLAEIRTEQLKLNCPMPINSGRAENITVSSNTLTVNYDIRYDNDTDDYHVTLFRCFDANAGGLGLFSPTASVVVFTADSGFSWFDLTNRANGFYFYLSESISTLFQKVDSGARMVYLMIQAPNQVTGISFFTYMNVFFGFLIALGIGLAIRGS